MRMHTRLAAAAAVLLSTTIMTSLHTAAFIPTAAFAESGQLPQFSMAIDCEGTLQPEGTPDAFSAILDNEVLVVNGKQTFYFYSVDESPNDSILTYAVSYSDLNLGFLLHFIGNSLNYIVISQTISGDTLNEWTNAGLGECFVSEG